MNFYLYLFIIIKLLVNLSNADSNNTNNTNLEVVQPQSLLNSTIEALNEFIRLTKVNCSKTDEIVPKQNSINFNVNFNFGLKKESVNGTPPVELVDGEKQKKKEKFTVVWLDNNQLGKQVELEEQERKPAKYYFRFARPRENLMRLTNEQNLQKLPFKPLRSRAEKPLNYFPYLSYDDSVLKNWMRKRNTNKNV